jgi:NAD(P)-dependent dehydrogenase (short-subunit alcohol dehydrogenase family)
MPSSSSISDQLFDLTGKTALVTGGSRGIGRGLALGLARQGADVAIVYRTAEKQADEVTQQIQECGRKAWAYQNDLSQTGGLEELAQEIWQQVGKIDILVNNAGRAYSERFNEIPLDHWRNVMAVNVDAVYFLTRYIAERMIASGIKGRVINISSANGFCAEAGHAHYNASKGALELLTQTFAIELGEHGITANTVCPGIIETEIIEEIALTSDYIDYFKQHVPLEARLGTVEECVGAVVLFASRAGSYITGQHLIIDGGVMCEQVPRLPFMQAYRSTIDPAK